MGKVEGKRLIGRQRRRWVIILKLSLKEQEGMACNGFDFITRTILGEEYRSFSSSLV